MNPEPGFGAWLARAQTQAQTWRTALFAALALLVALSFFIHPHEAHFGFDALPGFWAVFGCGVAVVMTLVLKKIVFPIISRHEEIL